MYRHTTPPPGVGDWDGPCTDTPSVVSACAIVGHVGPCYDVTGETGTVVAVATVVADDTGTDDTGAVACVAVTVVELDALLLEEPHVANTSTAADTATTNPPIVFTLGAYVLDSAVSRRPARFYSTHSLATAGPAGRAPFEEGRDALTGVGVGHQHLVIGGLACFDCRRVKVPTVPQQPLAGRDRERRGVHHDVVRDLQRRGQHVGCSATRGLHRPSPSASLPSNMRPVSRMSAAAAIPTMRGNV